MFKETILPDNTRVLGHVTFPITQNFLQVFRLGKLNHRVPMIRHDEKERHAPLARDFIVLNSLHHDFEQSGLIELTINPAIR